MYASQSYIIFNLDMKINIFTSESLNVLSAMYCYWKQITTQLHADYEVHDHYFSENEKANQHGQDSKWNW